MDRARTTRHNRDRPSNGRRRALLRTHAQRFLSTAEQECSCPMINRWCAPRTAQLRVPLTRRWNLQARSTLRHRANQNGKVEVGDHTARPGMDMHRRYV